MTKQDERYKRIVEIDRSQTSLLEEHRTKLHEQDVAMGRVDEKITDIERRLAKLEE